MEPNTGGPKTGGPNTGGPNTDGRVILLGCGDVGPLHPPVDAYSTLVQPVLAGADLRFAQCEKVYSTGGYMQVHSNGHYSRQPPEMATVFADCGFDIVSVAGNHAMDWGGEALLDTITLMNRMGIATVGGGHDIDEARRPVIFDKNGVRVGFLGYSSVLRDGYAATRQASGVAPMRAHAFYASQEYQPGPPPKVITIPDQADLNAFCDDITKLRDEVDVVIVSLHWGIHIIPKVLADYERVVARAAFDHGADLILGHHPHIPKGIEVFGDKVCFYSLSHFIFSQRELSNHVDGHTGGNRYGVEQDPDYPRLPFGKDGKRSLIARAEITKRGIERVSFLPVIIDTQLRPEVLLSSDPRFAEAVEYLDWASEELPHTFKVEGDEVVVLPA